MLEELKRLQKFNKEGKDKQDYLMSSAKVLQARIARNNKVRQDKVSVSNLTTKHENSQKILCPGLWKGGR